MRTGRLGNLSCADPAPGAARNISHAPTATATLRQILVIALSPALSFLRRSKASGFAGRMSVISELGKRDGGAIMPATTVAGGLKSVARSCLDRQCAPTGQAHVRPRYVP